MNILGEGGVDADVQSANISDHSANIRIHNPHSVEERQ